MVIDVFDVVFKEKGDEIVFGRVIWVEDDVFRVRASATAFATLEFTVEIEGCVVVIGMICCVYYMIGLVGLIFLVFLCVVDLVSEMYEMCVEVIF